MKNIYPTTKISERTHLHLADDIQIGDFNFIACNILNMADKACIGRFNELQGRGAIYIGEGAQVTSYCSLITSTDQPMGRMSDLEDEKYRRIRTGDIYIGRGAYVGPYTCLMPGTVVEEGAVIGAGTRSYIEGTIPAYAMVIPHKERWQREMYTRKRMIDDDCIYPWSGVGFKRRSEANDH